MTVINVQSFLQPYNVSRESQAGLETYVSVLVDWQRRINLIGPSTIADIWTRHILDAVQLIPLLPNGTRSLADLGTGAGIPGLVLSIASGLETHLYESNSKKVAFLRHVIRLTRAPAEVHQIRLETIPKLASVPKIDVVLARALAPLDLLLSYAEPFFRSGAAALFHKGQDIDIELTAATKYWNISFIKHMSITDSRGVILEVREAERVREAK